MSELRRDLRRLRGGDGRFEVVEERSSFATAFWKPGLRSTSLTMISRRRSSDVVAMEARRRRVVAKEWVWLASESES